MGAKAHKGAKAKEQLPDDEGSDDSGSDYKNEKQLLLFQRFFGELSRSYENELSHYGRKLDLIMLKRRFDKKPKQHQLHTAIKYNDVKTIKFYIDLGCELDVGDPSSGDSPLLVAAIHDSLEAAKLLRESYVDAIMKELFGADPESHRMYHHYKRKVELDHTERFVRQMIGKGFDATRIGKVLAGIHCDLVEVISFHDHVMTKAYLQSSVDSMRKNIGGPIFKDMYKLDLQHIHVLVNYGPEFEERKEYLVYALMENIHEYRKFEAGRDFLKKLATWEIFDEEFLAIFEDHLRRVTKRLVKVVLQYGFHSGGVAKFGRDVSKSIFGNQGFKVISLLKNREIDVDKRYHKGDTPLHVSAKYYRGCNVRLLLERGADPNAVNDEGDTPLSLVLKSVGIGHSGFEESVKHLLFANANPMSVSDQFEDTFFLFDPTQSDDPRDYSMAAFKYLVAHLAIYEVAGLSIEQSIRNLHHHELKKFLEECRRQLKTLKTHEIRDTTNNLDQDTYRMKCSIITILAERPEKVVRYFGEEDLQMIPKLLTAYNKKTLNSYYRELLRQRVNDIIKVHRYRKRAVQVICQFTGIDDSNHLVVSKILEYFKLKDLLILKDKKEK